LLVSGEIVEDKAIYDGGFAYRLVPQQDYLAFDGWIILHFSNVYIL
jgi:hypothetical protein